MKKNHTFFLSEKVLPRLKHIRKETGLSMSVIVERKILDLPISYNSRTKPQRTAERRA